ncbi:hypothetical protein O181_054255 [Austropuccinia psidii MF-1]|uniref:Uncharacterized protein n=1 Tax=Austropuccinia psidii MF-1 TaxID=1389203 RepID=A0A9Q3HU79_9BASI|nr:hypothetical protein [Austropuccinia psidii MF-1]
MRPKGARPLGPKPQVGPHGPILAHQSQRTKTLNWPYLALVLAPPRTGHWKSPEAIRHLLPGLSPQDQGRPFPIIGPKGCRNLGWGICGIIYSYAPFCLRNSMVNCSRPNSSISSHIPVYKSI